MDTEAVYEFMKSENRPFNLNDIVSKLPNGKGKPNIQQALDKLTKQNKIFERIYGKQKIWCLVQQSKHDASELMRIASEYQLHENELQRKHQELEKEIRSREETVAALKTGPTLEEALKDRDERKERINEREIKLDKLMNRSGSQDLGESKNKALKQLELYSREYSRRKRLCTDVIDSILEGFPGTKKQLYDDIGIEVKIVK